MSPLVISSRPTAGGLPACVGYEGRASRRWMRLIGVSIVNGVRHLRSEASEVTRVSHTEKILSSLSC
jgi:hypothetical protein